MARGRLLLIIAISESLKCVLVCSLVENCQAKNGTVCNVPNITRVNFQNYIEVLNGTNRTLSCKIHSDTALKEEPIWRKDSSRLSTELKYIVENASCSNPTSQTCIVSNLTLINAVRFEYKNPYVGNYSLTAENDCGTAVVYVFVDIIIPPTCEDDYNKPPQLKIPPPLIIQAVEGHSVTITAQYEGNKDDRNLGVYWCVYKTQDDYYCYTLNEDVNYNVSTDGCHPGIENCCHFTVLLKIKSVTHNLTLQSMVVWEQDSKQFIPGNSSLVVNVYPTLDKWIPNVNNQCVELTEGQSTEFTCIYNASTNPNVTITTWEFNEEPLEHDLSHYTITTQYGSDPANVNRVLSRIILSNVKPDNTGTYTCHCTYNPKVIDDKDVIVSEAASFCLKVTPVPWWLYALVAVVVVIVILIPVVLLVWCCYYKRREKKKSDQTSGADNVNEHTSLLNDTYNQMMNVVAGNHSINNQNDPGKRSPSRSPRDVTINTDQADNQAYGTNLSRNGHSTTKNRKNKADYKQPSSKLLTCPPSHQIESEPDGGKSGNQMMNVVADNHSINDQNGLRERNPSRSCRGVAISTDQDDNQEKSTKYNDATAAVTAVGTATATATSATGTATVTITADDNGTITATATAEPEGTCNQLSISRNGHLTTKSSKIKANSKPLLNRLPPHLIECESDGGKRITANTSDTIRKLLCRYVTELAPHWYYLGVELLEDTNSLIVIRENYPSDIEKCCNEMFNKWLNEDPKASLNKLISALKKLNLSPLAEKIRNDTSSIDRVENQDKLFSGQDPHPSHQKSHHQSGDMDTSADVAVEVHDQLPTRSTSLESFIIPSVNGHVDQPVTSNQDIQHGNNIAEKPIIPVFSTEEPIECEPEGPRIPHPAAVRPPGSERVLPRPLNQATNNVSSVDNEKNTAEASTGCHNKILNSIAPEFKHINMVSLLPHLQQHGLVTEDEEHHLIIEAHSSVKKAQLLLSYLKTKGDESLQKILCCLNLAHEHSGHKGIADKLKQMMEVNNIECADFCAEHSE